MYDKFDKALKKVLSSEITPYGIEEKGLLVATARRAAAENRIKALNEAMLGEFKFAKIHETASIRYHKDAEALAEGRQPVHHSICHFFLIAKAYSADDRDEKRYRSGIQKTDVA